MKTATYLFSFAVGVCVGILLFSLWIKPEYSDDDAIQTDNILPFVNNATTSDQCQSWCQSKEQ